MCWLSAVAAAADKKGAGGVASTYFSVTNASFFFSFACLFICSLVACDSLMPARRPPAMAAAAAKYE